MKIRFQILVAFIAVVNCYSQSGITDRIKAYGYLQSGAYSEAVNSFLVFGNILPEDRLSLGIAQFYTKDYSAARKNFQLADEAGVDLANLWLAKIYAVNNNANDAMLFIERYLKTSNNPDINAIQKDSIFRFLHQTDKWFDLWQTDWYSENQKIDQEITYLVARKKYQAAHQVIEYALSVNTSDAQLFLINSRIYLAEENPQLALNELNQALKLEPKNPDFLKARSECYILLKEYSSALEDINLLISINPADFESRIHRAESAYYAGDYELAEEDMSIYLQFFKSEEAIYLAGQISYAGENYLSALKYFNQLIKEAKPNALYYKARGLTFYQSNNFLLAANDLSMSLDLEPNNGETNFYKGLSEYYMGHIKDACYYWNRAKESGETKSLEYLQKYCN